MTYYNSGLPYSEELYHHGILGQKWGVRRFQNPDGTRTAAGKLRYAVKEVGSRAIARTKENYKRKHPELMTTEELVERMKRIEMENRYKDMLRANNKSVSRGKQVIQEILESSAKTLTSNAINNFTQVAREKEMQKLRSMYEKKQAKRNKKLEQKRYNLDQARKEEERKREKERSDKEYERSLAGQFDKSVSELLSYNREHGIGMDPKEISEFATISENLRKIQQRSSGEKKKK